MSRTGIGHSEADAFRTEFSDAPSPFLPFSSPKSAKLCKPQRMIFAVHYPGETTAQGTARTVAVTSSDIGKNRTCFRFFGS